MPSRLLVLFFVLFFSGMQAQTRLLVTGKVTRAENGEALQGTVVMVVKTKNIMQANTQGTYAILVDLANTPVLEFRFFGCETRKIPLNSELLKKAGNDTLRLDVQLKYKSFMYEGATIRPKTADTVIGNWRFFIEDYLFTGDRYVLLTWEKSLKAAKVMLVSEKDGIIAQQSIPKEAVELYRDYQGFINIICKDGFYRVRVKDDELKLIELPADDFASRVLPCIDTLGSLIVFTNYNPDYPAFSYFTFNFEDTSITRFRMIVDEPLLGLYNYEFDYLKPKDRLYARKMEMYTGVDKRIIAASMTGFSKSQFYTPLYAPLFVVNDTVHIFDHYTSKLYKYNRQCRVLDSLPINYHKPKSWKDWDRKLIQDEVTKEIYTLYEKDGNYALKKIDLKTGKVTGTYKISNRYAKRIHIRNGQVYYIYRPYESTQKKFLYREDIILTEE